ncbi:MAG: SGNH/GDSL hydrolase family protein [Clostridia bacterium]|nr:SGNH/GDSL hydrolase family protein [Clostridia bacterium]
MLLDYEKICEITFGAVSVTEENGFYNFYRFSEEQFLNIIKKGGTYYQRSIGTASIRFSFVTKSEHISFTYKLTAGSSRKFAGFDLYENGVMKGHAYITDDMPQTDRINFTLSKGEKHVELYFPFSKCASLSAVEIDDGCEIKAVKRSRKMIAFGDSITQGYDATHPSLSYVNQLSAMLDADCINKGIGGECFCPELPRVKDNINPEIVTVAYGTNDWSKKTFEEFDKNCTDFFKALYSSYSNSKIVVITPLWRYDANGSRKINIPHSAMHSEITKRCDFIPGIQIINGYELFPNMTSFFLDEKLHPNDLGFSIYVNNLYRQIHI